MESRRRRWISRARSFLLIGISIYLAVAAIAVGLGIAVPTLSLQERILVFFLASSFYGIIAVLLLAARYLRNQRERIDLTANAQELRNAFQSLRKRAGDVGIVTVPSELLNQTAKIEAAQIAKERKDAVLESITSASKEYAVAFDLDAVEQRATLGVADRVELGDLVAELSTEGAQLETQAEAIPGTNSTTLRGTTKSKRVEIEYVIDHRSQTIRVIAVRHGGANSRASLHGG
jgi:hypothetical protein